MEHHHIQSARAIINESQLLDDLGAAEKEAILQLMDDLVLGTDFTQHKYYLGLFESKLNEGVDIRHTSEDRKFVLMVGLCVLMCVCRLGWELFGVAHFHFITFPAVLFSQCTCVLCMYVRSVVSG